MNPVGWFEIYVQDLDRARRFYEQVMQVSLQPMPDPSGEGVEMLAFPMDSQGPGASGALVRMAGVPSGGSTLVYFVCEDCGETAERVAAAGGTVHRPKMSIGQFGFIALAIDTEGNMIGLHSGK
ncbi:VOC family protein [Luteitalea sp. TBR-22]|uniref:VOC family protein n=1 Tax=Luteitalea sp. TBR-22 TaxID=2802971 RepID=UPI001EF56ADF|nr:VOC family protein [Luteitalea sp. TBR-22]